MHYKSSKILTSLWWKCSWVLINVAIPVNHHNLSLFVWHSEIRFYLKKKRHSFLFITQFLYWALSKLSIVSFLYSFSSILSALIKTTEDSAGNPVGLLMVSWSHLFFHCFCLLNPVMFINPSPASHWIPNFPLSAPLFAPNWAPPNFPYPIRFSFLPPLTVRPSPQISLLHPVPGVNLCAQAWASPLMG